jgi:hypothetical protein
MKNAILWDATPCNPKTPDGTEGSRFLRYTDKFLGGCRTSYVRRQSILKVRKNVHKTRIEFQKKICSIKTTRKKRYERK